jgi:hypothetical protein
MRAIEVIDSKLRLLLAIRHMICEVQGRPPSTAHIDELPHERLIQGQTQTVNAAVAAGLKPGIDPVSPRWEDCDLTAAPVLSTQAVIPAGRRSPRRVGD